MFVLVDQGVLEILERMIHARVCSKPVSKYESLNKVERVLVTALFQLLSLSTASIRAPSGKTPSADLL